MRNVAILIFDDAEVLDFCGPFEVFSTTNELQDEGLLRVYTVARSQQAIRARNGLRVEPDFPIERSPRPDIVLVPGGQGARNARNDELIIAWLQRCAGSAELLLSVCTGALIFARAGLLDGLKATTHHEVLEELRRSAPRTEVVAGRRFIDNGQVIVSAGISAGIDMCLYVVTRLFGEETARRTAVYMEYDRPHPAVFGAGEKAEIYYEMVVNAEIGAVWRQWTTPEGLCSFFAPRVNVELEAGGLFEILFDPDAEAGERGAEGMRILALEDQAMLSFTWNAPPRYRSLRPQRTLVQVAFEKLAPEATRVSLRHTGFGFKDQWPEVLAYFRKAWGAVVLPRLKYSLETGPLDWRAPPDLSRYTLLY
jgi:putative intracellular protease/amidase/uncharacterized protein YndB with AHSA1/START domain